MRRWMTVFAAAALVGLISATASADVVYQMGMNSFYLGNDDYSIDPAVNPAFAPGGWTATTQGALWIDKGSGPVINTQDLNIRLDYRSTPTSPWITVTGAYLIGDGTINNVGYADCNWLAYPGQFGGCDGALGIPGDDTSPYRHPAPGGANMGEYVLPGTGPTDENPYGVPTQAGMQFNLYLGGPATLAPFLPPSPVSAQVATSGAFQVGTTSYWIMPQDTAFSNMPSMLLKKSLVGDANFDGKVDINDLSKVLTNYDKTGMIWSDGDFNDDGKVDINDLSAVLTNYDHSLGASAAGVASVPEPSCAALLLVGAFGLLAYAWGRRR